MSYYPLDMASLSISRHPLVRDKLRHLRDRETDSTRFRQLVRELANLLAYEATADLLLERQILDDDGALSRPALERIRDRQLARRIAPHDAKAARCVLPGIRSPPVAAVV